MFFLSFEWSDPFFSWGHCIILKGIYVLQRRNNSDHEQALGDSGKETFPIDKTLSNLFMVAKRFNGDMTDGNNNIVICNRCEAGLSWKKALSKLKVLSLLLKKRVSAYRTYIGSWFYIQKSSGDYRNHKETGMLRAQYSSGDIG